MDLRELAQKIDYAFSEYVPDEEATAGGVLNVVEFGDARFRGLSSWHGL